MSSNTKGAARTVAALSAVGVVAASVAFATPAAADDHVVRVEGGNRYATALEAAKAAFPSRPDSVVIASGEDFPDALAGSALAGCLDAPILLTKQDDLPDGVGAYLNGPGKKIRDIYVLGGLSAVGANVEAEIRNSVNGNEEITRIGGANRYETAELIAEEFYPDTDGVCAGETAGLPDFEAVAILATGQNYPDALAAGSQAFAGPHPVLLSKTAALSDEAADALEGLEADGVVVMGGDDALSTTGVVDELDPTVVVTVAGENRYDTARLLATTLVSLGAQDPTNVGLASGQDFPDALSSAPYLGSVKAPLVLTKQDSLPDETAEFLDLVNGDVETLHVFGGTEAISDDVAEAAATAAGL